VILELIEVKINKVEKSGNTGSDSGEGRKHSLTVTEPDASFLLDVSYFDRAASVIRLGGS